MQIAITNSIETVTTLDSASGAQPNLSAIVDDSTGKYTDEQRAQAFGDREARDQAIMAPAVAQGMATSDSTIPWRAALSLLNSLSPEEQDSPRYRGTRQEILAAIAAGNGPNPIKSGPAGLEDIPPDSQDSAQVRNGATSDKSIFGKMIYLHQAKASSQRAAGQALQDKEFGPGKPLSHGSELPSNLVSQTKAPAVDFTA